MQQKSRQWASKRERRTPSQGQKVVPSANTKKSGTRRSNWFSSGLAEDGADDLGDRVLGDGAGSQTVANDKAEQGEDAPELVFGMILFQS